MCFAFVCFAFACFAFACFAFVCFAFVCRPVERFAFVCFAFVCFAFVSRPVERFAFVCRPVERFGSCLCVAHDLRRVDPRLLDDRLPLGVEATYEIGDLVERSGAKLSRLGVRLVDQPRPLHPCARQDLFPLGSSVRRAVPEPGLRRRRAPAPPSARPPPPLHGPRRRRRLDARSPPPRRGRGLLEHPRVSRGRRSWRRSGSGRSRGAPRPAAPRTRPRPWRGPARGSRRLRSPRRRARAGHERRARRRTATAFRRSRFADFLPLLRRALLLAHRGHSTDWRAPIGVSLVRRRLTAVE